MVPLPPSRSLSQQSTRSGLSRTTSSTNITFDLQARNVVDQRNIQGTNHGPRYQVSTSPIQTSEAPDPPDWLP